MESNANPPLIIGYGDIGTRVARLHIQQGEPVVALTRSPASTEFLSACGIIPLIGDLDDPFSLRGLPVANAVVYYFAPPPAEGSGDTRMAGFLASLDALPAKLVYISTSGVYGDCGGATVSEERPPNPQTRRARARLAAETALLEWASRNAVPAVILRVGGIYGPGRLPTGRIRAGAPVVRVEEAPCTNRIHAADLARVCVAAAQRGVGSRLYNVSDGVRSTMTYYFNTVADHYGLPRPVTISLAEARTRLSPEMVSYLNESRHLDTRRLREELGVELLYPDLKAGLVACDAADVP